MPKRIVPLTDLQINKAKAQEKPVTMFDGAGLFLLVTPTGGKLWRFKYRFEGKEKLLALGTYPEISLTDARNRREDARKLLANGVDPGEIKKAQKQARHSTEENSFEVLARAWHKANVPNWADSHAKTTLARLEKNIFPWIGSKPVNEVKLSDIKGVLRRIEERAPESARRMYVSLNMIFRYCVASEMIERSPMEGLKPRDLLTTNPIRHHLPAITDPKELGALLRAIDEFKGSFVVKCALQLAAMTFQRPGDLRHMEWADIDLGNAEWNIPVEKMKLTKKAKAERKGDRHCVPLAAQALDILRQLHPLTGHSRYVFPGHRTHLKPLSEAALTAALHRMGYRDEMSWHGFRATARTILDEVLGFRPDFIEHQLAHAVRDALGRAYNRTSHLPERKKMMQTWADYLTGLKAEKAGKVLPIRKPAQG
jgi:integrase